MADQDRNSDMIAADARRIADGEALAEQLGQTTSEDAGGNVSGTAADASRDGFDIVFEYEDSEDTRH